MSMITRLTTKEKMIANIIFMLEHKCTDAQKHLLVQRGYLLKFETEENPYKYTCRHIVNMDIFDGKGVKELNEMYMDVLREFGGGWTEYENSTESISVDANGVAWTRE